MQRLVRENNIERLEWFLRYETAEHGRETLRRMLREERRSLALLEAASCGVRPWAKLQGAGPLIIPPDAATLARFRNGIENSTELYLLLDPRPGLRIVDANQAYRSATLTGPKIYGAGMFDVFPDNPDDPAADGVSNLFCSLRQASQTGQTQTMAVQRYDVRNAAGDWVERYWRPVNTPVFDEEHRLVFLLHHVENVTAQVQAARDTPRRGVAAG